MSQSVPASPAASRSTKTHPLTPQRPSYNQQRPLSLYRSPVTPLNSPYTPISLRSLNSNGSSTLTTPDNSGYSTRKRLVFAGSPEIVRNGNLSKDKSLADIAENWRSCTGSAPSKASYANHDDSGFVLDDCESIYALYRCFSFLNTRIQLATYPFLKSPMTRAFYPMKVGCPLSSIGYMLQFFFKPLEHLFCRTI
jgi:hypothetical protein